MTARPTNKSAESDLGYQLGLISFIRPATVIRNTHRFHTVSPKRYLRAGGVLAGGLLGSPLRMWESVRNGRRIDEIEIDKPPVFIVGHWRSGTTHLHNLMSQDEQFGCVRMAQALAPDCSLTTRSWLPDLFSRIFPTRRPMDNLEWPMDAPQEEEIPLTKVTPYSWYLQFLFPKQALEMFKLGVLFEGTSARVKREIRQKYLRILKVASLHDGGRRLLLKNPVSTARIPMLLELFPDAKFVAIHRSPYEVYPSTMNLHRKILNLTSFQDYDDDLIEQNVLAIYDQVMHKYLDDRDLIPSGNLVEVAYVDLDEEPREVLERIYAELGLDGFAEAAPAIDAYIDSQAGYVKNGFTISERAAELIEDRWSFAFDEFGYTRRSEAAPRAVAEVRAVTNGSSPAVVA